MLKEAEGVRVENFTGSLSAISREVRRLLNYGLDIGFDLETTDTDPINSKIVTLAFKPKGKLAVIFDVRHLNEKELRSLGSMLQPLFDQVTLIGQNLKFDLEFVFAQMGIRGHRVYDTMLADQVILGLGVSSAAEKGIHFSLLDIAERYGLAVEKESRSYFIHMDQDPERWNAPLPPEQLHYIRQDVSVVHKIKELQVPIIERDGLGEVVELENRTVLPLAGIEVFGVQINREGWLSVIDRVKSKADELETILHLGKEGEFEGLDVHVLKVRHERYMEKWRPYETWMEQRDEFLATQKTGWELGDLPEYKNWSECKKASLEWWYKEHGKLTKPPSNKVGVNLGSWMQVRDGFNDLFADPSFWQPVPYQGSGKPSPINAPVVLQSVSEEDLERLRHVHPLVGVYLEYVKARKIVTVYGRERGKKERAFIELLDSHDRLRASYQQIGADTGRMSSYSPNFQQIPVDGIGAELRRHVIAAPGHTLVVADFSNIELRIVAELSGDKFLLDAFKSGEDVHAYTAKVMFDLDIPAGEDAKKWTSTHDAVIGGRVLPNTTYRKIAKTINYMLLYGAGVRKLASMLNVEEKDARTLLNTYYATFSTAIGWLNAQKERLAQAKDRHEAKVFAVTRSGRRRYFDIPHYPRHPANGSAVSVEAHEKWLLDVEEWRKKNASIKRQLANTPIQGLSADITKEAAAQWYEVADYADGIRLVALIHDEFIVECKPERVHEAKTILREVMCRAMEKYLHVVDLGDVEPIETMYWMH